MLGVLQAMSQSEPLIVESEEFKKAEEVAKAQSSLLS